MAGRINLRGYDPRLAEEADQRQKEFAQNQLGQIGELGSIQTQGIKGLGETASDAVTGGVNSYLEGQKIARDKEAHALRVKLAQQNLDSQAAEEKLLNASYNPLAAAQAEEGSPEKPLTNAQQLFNLKLQKLKTEAQAPRGKSVFSGSPHVSASGIPMRFNSETGTYEEAGNVPVRIKDDRRGPPKLQQTQFTGADGAPLLYDPESGAYTSGKVPEGFTTPKDQNTEVYGAEKLPGLKPTPKDAETVKSSRAARDAIAKNIARLDELYQKHGTQMVGNAAAEMEGISTDIQLNLKELQNLGVLNGPDLALLQKQVPEPTSFKENVKGIVGQDRYDAKRNSFIESLENKFETGIQARGYKRKDQRLGPLKAKAEAAAEAGPAAKAPEEMTPEERAAELARLRGK